MQVVLSATLSRLYRVLGDIHMSSDTLVEIFCWFSDFYPCSIVVAYAENFHGRVIQWHMVVICIWCALFVTSQFDVIFMFPNQRFGEVF